MRRRQNDCDPRGLGAAADAYNRCLGSPRSARLLLAGPPKLAARRRPDQRRCCVCEVRAAAAKTPRDTTLAPSPLRRQLIDLPAVDAVQRRKVTEVLIQRGAPHPERPGDLRHRHVAALAHRQRRGPLLGGEFHRTAAEPAGGLGDLPAGLGALADQLALELGQGGEDVQLQLAGRGGGVDRPRARTGTRRVAVRAGRRRRPGGAGCGRGGRAARPRACRQRAGSPGRPRAAGACGSCPSPTSRKMRAQPACSSASSCSARSCWRVETRA